MGLPYWPILGTPHCLDVMHITKNVCESLLGTLFNMPDRTEDDDEPEEEDTQGHKRKRVKQHEWYCPPSCFTLSPNELDRVFQCLLGVRVPNGYSGLISRYLDPVKKILQRDEVS